jgi:hypothetical protein
LKAPGRLLAPLSAHGLSRCSRSWRAREHEDNFDTKGMRKDHATDSGVPSSHEHAFRIQEQAGKMGVSIPFPLTFDEFLKGQYFAKGVRKIHIDDVDDLVRYIAKGLCVETITLTTEFVEGEG